MDWIELPWIGGSRPTEFDRRIVVRCLSVVAYGSSSRFEFLSAFQPEVEKTINRLDAKTAISICTCGH